MTTQGLSERPIVVRAATTRDRGFVLDTAARLAAFEPPPHRTREQIVRADRSKLAAWFSPARRLRRCLARRLRGPGGCALLVAERDGAPLGFVQVCRAREYFDGREEGRLDVIAVSAAAAGHGAGAALMRAAEDWARARGYETIALDVIAANRRAREVYEHLGYEVDTVHYVKSLQAPHGAGNAPAPSRPRQREWFDDDGFWRELYPVIFTEQRFAEAASEVARLLALAPPTGQAVLDLACGPGRCAVELARRDYRVTGVDRTAFLLERAAERAAREGVVVEWVLSDMRDFVRPCAYSLVLSLFTSFGYFGDPDEDRLVLRRMLDSLAPGAPCVIDVVGKEVLARLFQPTTTERLSDGAEVVKRHDVRADWTRLHEEWTVTRDGRSRRFRYDHALYSGRELRERMERAGFVDVRLYGGFDGEPYGPDAASLLAVGRRPA